MIILPAGFFGTLITLAHVAAALAVTIHVALNKRNVRSAIGWIGLAWLSPFIGAPLYLLLGINRIQRAGASLRLQDSWAGDVSLPSPHPHEDVASIGHAHFVGLDRLVSTIIGRPLAAGNRIVPLQDGDEAYPAMLEAIAAAERSIAMSSYIFDDDASGRAFMDALTAAHRRGVQVRVLVDAVGVRYSKHSSVDRLRRLGVPAALFLPTRIRGLFRYANLRNHRKILVVDGTVGFTGGMNIRAGHVLSSSPAYPIRCLHFRVEGPILADLLRTFAIDWAFSSGESLSGAAWAVSGERKGRVLARGIPDGPDTDIDNMRNVILGALAAATTSVRVVTPYFLPDGALSAALRICALRGVPVDIVLPERSNIFVMDWAMRPQLSGLIESGCRVCLSPPPFDHAKIFVVDRVWSLIGSTNWDPRSLRLNFEYNLECYDAELAGKLDDMAAARIDRARPLSLEDLRALPPHIRFRDGIARLLTPYL
jgi:cardiolipin synthase